jgi:uncharacterized membrane protein YgcG
MMPSVRRAGMTLLLAAGLLGAGVASAALLLVSEVKDEGGFFKPEAISKANKLIRDIKNQHKKDLVIETYKGVSEKRKDDLEKLGKARFFEEWARNRARALEVNGIYILICKEPPHLQVEIGNETQKKAFTLRDRDRLIELLVGRLKEKEYDEGLLETVEFVNKTLGNNLR